jgi:hypothetical protein
MVLSSLVAIEYLRRVVLTHSASGAAMQRAAIACPLPDRRAAGAGDSLSQWPLHPAQWQLRRGQS